jgi:hypothetical protein
VEPLIWAVQGLLAAAFAYAAWPKLTRPRLARVAQRPYLEDLSDAQDKAVGAAELAAAGGLVLPAALGIAPVLTPVAGLGVATLMTGAAVLHVRRGEPQMLPVNFALGALGLAVAVLRLGPYAV